jgi:hypothetical protein
MSTVFEGLYRAAFAGFVSWAVVRAIPPQYLGGQDEPATAAVVAPAKPGEKVIHLPAHGYRLDLAGVELLDVHIDAVDGAKGWCLKDRLLVCAAKPALLEARARQELAAGSYAVSNLPPGATLAQPVSVHEQRVTIALDNVIWPCPGKKGTVHVRGWMKLVIHDGSIAPNAEDAGWKP